MQGSRARPLSSSLALCVDARRVRTLYERRTFGRASGSCRHLLKRMWPWGLGAPGDPSVASRHSPLLNAQREVYPISLLLYCDRNSALTATRLKGERSYESTPAPALPPTHRVPNPSGVDGNLLLRHPRGA